MQDNVDRDSAAAGEAHALLLFKVAQRLRYTALRLGVNRAALMQRTVDRGFTDASLSSDLLDGKFHF
ncbi:hypothetical protein GCM10027361_33080 [Erwinia aphidicola]